MRVSDRVRGARVQGGKQEEHAEQSQVMSRANDFQGIHHFEQGRKFHQRILH